MKTAATLSNMPRPLGGSLQIQRPELPQEIWRQIAGFLSDSETWQLRGLNSAFLAASLDSIYRQVRVIETGLSVYRMELVASEVNKTVKTITRPLTRTIRLRCVEYEFKANSLRSFLSQSDPWISHRVREVQISHPGCPCLSIRQQPSVAPAAPTATPSQRMKALLIRPSKKSALPPQDLIAPTVLTVLSKLADVKTLELEVGSTFQCPFIEQGWILLSRNLTTLRLTVQRRVDLIAFTLLLTHHTPCCEHLEELTLWLWLALPRSRAEDERALLSLAELAPRSLRTLRLHGQEYNPAVFLERDRFPLLKALVVTATTNDKNCQKIREDALSSFLESPPAHLTHVSLGWSQSTGQIDVTYLTHLSLAHTILDSHLLHQFQAQSRNLVQLELSMSACRSPRQSLSLVDVKTIAKALSTADNLRRLKLNTDTFDTEGLVTVATFLPRLEQLWWAARFIVVQVLEPQASVQLRRLTLSAHAAALQAWQLEYLWLDVPLQNAAAQVMESLAPFVKSLKCPKKGVTTVDFIDALMKEWEFDIGR
ncbi:hypothetical protein DL96DRAFT_1623487 [Flagelloscypha sp. PMI_526]|nr:hypothetical protein DL96DRAFT_1623487 [Flagelloscypha sp. PMI_526]